MSSRNVHYSNADIDVGSIDAIDYRVDSSLMKSFALHNQFWILINRTDFNYHTKAEKEELYSITTQPLKELKNDPNICVTVLVERNFYVNETVTQFGDIFRLCFHTNFLFC